MRLRPLEILHAAVAACLGMLTLGLVLNGRLAEWFLPALCSVSMFILVALMAWLAARESRLPLAARLALNFYPVLTVSAVFEALGSLLPSCIWHDGDKLLILADRQMFGQDPTVWLERFARPELTDVLYIAYASYHFLPLLLGIVLWRKSEAIAKQYCFSMSLAFFINYAGYFLIPARGPRFALAHRQNVILEVTPISQAIYTTLNLLEHPKLDAFPSAHVMAIVFCLIFSFAYERRFFFLILPLAILIIISTIYCRYHYVVDIMAGALLAAVLYPASKKLYQKLNSLRVAKENSR